MIPQSSPQKTVVAACGFPSVWLALLSVIGGLTFPLMAAASSPLVPVSGTPALGVGRLREINGRTGGPIAQQIANTRNLLLQWAGELNEGSQQLEDGRYYTPHSFEGVEGEIIAIELSSEALNMRLILQRLSWTSEVESDDGDGTNSRLVVTLPESGLYIILASASAVGETGAYQLVVRAATERDQQLARADVLNQQSIKLFLSGRYQEAIGRAEEGLSIRRMLFGDSHPDVAESMDTLAFLYTAQGRYEEAEPLHEESLALRREFFENPHPDVAESLNNLATLYTAQGRYGEAEPLYKESLGLRRELWGDSHLGVATSLIGLAELYRKQGRYGEAERLYEEILPLSRELLGDSHPLLAVSMNNLALLYSAQGRYEEAEPLYKEALMLQRASLEDSHPTVVTIMHNLASLYHEQGRYEEAESQYDEALELRRKFLGGSHLDVAASLNNLANLYTAQGRYGEAEPLYEESLSIQRASLEDSHPTVVTSLNNLALLYHEQGRYEEAESQYDEALELRRSALGEFHPDVATSLDNLALLYRDQGRYEEAESRHDEALELRRELLGERHPSVASSLHNLALLYRAQGRYGEAERLYEEALALRRELLGERHPSVAISLNSLAALYWRQGRLNQALSTLQASLEVEESVLTRNLIGGSEAEKQTYLSTFGWSRAAILSLHLGDMASNAEAAQAALTTVLQRKGRLLDLFTTARQSLRQQLTPEGQALLEELDQAHGELSRLTFQPPGAGGLSPDAYTQQVAALEAKIADLQEDLTRYSQQFQLLSQPIELTAIQSLLPASSALVEFVRYRAYDPKAGDSGAYQDVRYAAYILKPDREIRGVDLGAATAIEAGVEALRKVLRNPGFPPAQVQSVAHDLEQLILAPLRRELADVEHLLVSPDAALNLIPFEALADESGRYLVETYEISYLTSGRDLLRLEGQAESASPPLVVADPVLGRPGEAVIGTARTSSGDSRFVDLKSATFSPLPGAAEEGAAISAQLAEEGAQLRQGVQATEAAIKQTARPRILHVATHGFFYPEAADSTQGATSENPLLRSGLVLSGFRVGQSGAGEDGILTALEISGLNLSGTELVVLSACDTGLGDLSISEGVYGLRRGLVLSGAESQVISLWRVEDQSTQELMVAYYENLLAGQGRSAALRQKQLEMIHSEVHQHPYHWAAFIASGDWRPLD